MNEDFVTYEQALKLKELGFDWECDYCCEDNRELLGTINVINVHEFYHLTGVKLDNALPAPTLAQAAKWLRDVKGIIICIEPRFYKNKRPLVGYDYHLFNKDDGWYSDIESKTVYDTYEEALSEAISKALEILE